MAPYEKTMMNLHEENTLCIVNTHNLPAVSNFIKRNNCYKYVLPENSRQAYSN